MSPDEFWWLDSTPPTPNAFEMLLKSAFNLSLSANSVIIEYDAISAYIER